MKLPFLIRAGILAAAVLIAAPGFSFASIVLDSGELVTGSNLSGMELDFRSIQVDEGQEAEVQEEDDSFESGTMTSLGGKSTITTASSIGFLAGLPASDIKSPGLVTRLFIAWTVAIPSPPGFGMMRPPRG